MPIVSPTFDVPKTPAERREWIRYRLRAAGYTWRSLGRELGVSGQALQQTASGLPSRRLEKLIAAKLGVPEQRLFQEHYDKSGSRIPVERASFGRAEDSAPKSARNAEKREVA